MAIASLCQPPFRSRYRRTFSCDEGSGSDDEVSNSFRDFSSQDGEKAPALITPLVSENLKRNKILLGNSSSVLSSDIDKFQRNGRKVYSRHPSASSIPKAECLAVHSEPSNLSLVSSKISDTQQPALETLSQTESYYLSDCSSTVSTLSSPRHCSHSPEPKLKEKLLFEETIQTQSISVSFY